MKTKVRCLNCGATWETAGECAETELNCDQCPEHDDIARRNQESADRDEEAKDD